jgi:hypothetical protein
MTDYKMTAEYQKILTEMIGECRHEKVSCEKIPDTSYAIYRCSCGAGGDSYALKYHLENNGNRSFTTDPDMMKVFRWLVDEEKWEKIRNYLMKYYGFALLQDNTTLKDYIAWLFYDAERFNVLAAEAKKEGVI